MIKRAGRGHDLAGVNATTAGACAILCPACPQPNLNLSDQVPHGAPDHKYVCCSVDMSPCSCALRWKSRMAIAIDACFKLKRKARDIKDVELGSGWAYFVNEDSYQAYLKDCPDNKEISPCTSELNAVKQAYSKGSNAGIAVTGVVGVKCARHAFVLLNGIADLQKGERYCNVDYAVLSVLSCLSIRKLGEVDLSYDIACSWTKNFIKRAANVPVDAASDISEVAIRPLIPKAHIEGHGPSCRTKYSFNYAVGVGCGHGETTEEEWAIIIRTTISTREMGPGTRHATLNDHWGW
ncbi:hypothetical protein CERSUDRAFT_59683 [Gelatoporia subvermispora B]|uniref:CxC2-like cysteine cluster KDZ transposase-associated domain-containing protein n=1 Tax=Ceriporiopsis subvermispora (strain B) TaxID=914234 RepID=M2QYU2_CERS8|nr:hypothetical protein CERSUDRAFT_59683 [Gelatoporia subvermispora B]